MPRVVLMAGAQLSDLMLAMDGTAAPGENSSAPNVHSSAGASAGPARVSKGHKPKNPAARTKDAKAAMLRRELKKLQRSASVEEMEQKIALLRGAGAAPKNTPETVSTVEPAAGVAKTEPKEPVPAGKPGWPTDAEVEGCLATGKLAVSTLSMLADRFEPTRGSISGLTEAARAEYERTWAAALAEWQMKAQMSPTGALLLQTATLFGPGALMAGIATYQKRRAARGEVPQELRAA